MWQTQKAEVLSTARRMHEAGLVVGTTGNVSTLIREPSGRRLVAVTPSGCHYDRIESKDIVLVNLQGEPIEGDFTPSIETGLHLAIYRARKDIGAIVHAHSTYASAIAVAGRDIPLILDDQARFLGGSIRVAEYAPPGSSVLAQKAVAGLGARNGVLLANHGALTVGRDLRQALDNCQLLEKTAKIYVLSLHLGEAKALPPAVMES